MRWQGGCCVARASRRGTRSHNLHARRVACTPRPRCSATVAHPPTPDATDQATGSTHEKWISLWSALLAPIAATDPNAAELLDTLVHGAFCNCDVALPDSPLTPALLAANLQRRHALAFFQSKKVWLALAAASAISPQLPMDVPLDPAATAAKSFDGKVTANPMSHWADLFTPTHHQSLTVARAACDRLHLPPLPHPPSPLALIHRPPPSVQRRNTSLPHRMCSATSTRCRDPPQPAAPTASGS